MNNFEINTISVNDVLHTLRECDRNERYEGMFEQMLTFASELTGISEDTLMGKVYQQTEKEKELDILYDLLHKLKIYDIYLSHGKNGMLRARDDDGNRWSGKDFYHFVTEECLDFGADGQLLDGMYVPEYILEPYKRLSSENGVIPGQSENNLNGKNAQVGNTDSMKDLLKDAAAIEYKGIIFDDFTVDSDNSVWAEICEDCANQYKDLILDELDDAGAVGICSVLGCEVTGLETENEHHYYIDFIPELIHPLTKEQLMQLKSTHSEEKPCLDDQIHSASTRTVSPGTVPEKEVERS